MCIPAINAIKSNMYPRHEKMKEGLSELKTGPARKKVHVLTQVKEIEVKSKMEAARAGAQPYIMTAHVLEIISSPPVS
jgi:hypothetical protein